MTFRRDINQAILALAPRHHARATAPGTLADLMGAACAGASLPVWEGASDSTWYRDARVNHAARAWHDSCHVAGAYAFTPAGERLACLAQCRALLRAFPGAPQAALRFVWCEVMGQVDHFARCGAFPENQEQFVNEAMQAVHGSYDIDSMPGLLSSRVVIVSPLAPKETTPNGA